MFLVSVCDIDLYTRQKIPFRLSRCLAAWNISLSAKFFALLINILLFKSQADSESAALVNKGSEKRFIFY